MNPRKNRNSVFEKIRDFLRKVVSAIRSRGNDRRTFRRKIGDAGEDFAAAFLKREGMKILCRNFCSGRDEIDIVARERDTIVFVEVKTRAETDAHGAVFAVDARKRKALKRAASAYLRALKTRPARVRLDVVEVYVRGNDGAMRAVLHRAIPWRK